MKKKLSTILIFTFCTDLLASITYYDEINETEKSPQHYYIEAMTTKPENITESLKNYIKAADKGHSQAAFELGCMYYYGEGIPQNTKKGIWYLNIAAKDENLHRARAILKEARTVKDNDDSDLSESKYYSKEMKKYGDYSLILKQIADGGSVLFYIVGIDCVSKRFNQLSSFAQLLWGGSRIGYGITETMRTGEKRNLINVVSGFTIVGNLYIQQEINEQYYEALSKKEVVEQQILVREKKIKLLEEEKNKLDKSSDNNSISTKKSNRTINNERKEIDRLVDKREELEETVQNSSLKKLTLDVTSEVIDKTSIDVNNGENVQFSVVKNSTWAFTKAMLRAAAIEHGPRIRKSVINSLYTKKSVVADNAVEIVKKITNQVSLPDLQVPNFK